MASANNLPLRRPTSINRGGALAAIRNAAAISPVGRPLANLRLPRFLGDRLARKAIMLRERIDCDSPTGRMICDEIVADGEIDTALTALVHGLTDSGVVSAVGNRRQFRIGREPLDLFREYPALLAKQQADCHFSSGLISNLECYSDAETR